MTSVHREMPAQQAAMTSTTQFKEVGWLRRRLLICSHRLVSNKTMRGISAQTVRQTAIKTKLATRHLQATAVVQLAPPTRTPSTVLHAAEQVAQALLAATLLLVRKQRAHLMKEASRHHQALQL